MDAEETGRTTAEELIEALEVDRSMSLEDFYRALKSARETIDARIALGREAGECE